MPDMLEPEFAPLYHAWKASGRPEHAAALLESVRPTIRHAIKLHVGEPNPLLESRARLMTLAGMRSYDPTRAKLATHLTNHLIGLKRVNRQQTTILKVPERVSLDRYHLGEAVRDFADRHGREPSDAELATHTGLSLARVRRVKSYHPAVAEGTLEALGVTPGVQGHDAEPIWHRIVYDDLAPRDQRIVDLNRSGVPNHEIARRLGVTPGAVSQRKAVIQRLFDDGERLGAL